MSLSVAILTTDKREHERRYDEPMPSFGTAPEALLQGFAGFPGLEVHVLSCTQKPMSSPEKLADNIWFHSVHVPKLGWLRTLYQGCVRATRKKLREIRPDIVHGQGTERDCALNAVFSGFPNVLTIHGNMRLVAQVERTWYWRLAARLEAFTVPRSNGVVCITQYTRAAVAGLAKKTWIVPNAVDENFFHVRPDIDPGAPPLILCVGAVCVRKNQNAFIRALDALSAKHQFKVLFCGAAPPEDAYCREFLKLVAGRPWCAHEGFVGRERLKTCMSRAAILALPSLEDNCPMVVLEAMAVGVPVMAADVGGVPDLVVDGTTGLLCDPSDAASMSGSVERLLTQAEQGKRLAAAAKQQAHERFHPKIVARRHVEIYREVLGR